MSAVSRYLRRSALAGPIADGIKWLRDPRTMRRLLQDAQATRRQAAFARNLPAPRVDAPKLLVLSMSDTPYNAKLEAMLSLELRRRGWRVQVLTSNVYTNARRIFEAYGIDDLVAFETLLWDPEIHRQVSAETARRAAEPMDFQSVMRWTYRDAWIGPLLLASVSRARFSGAPDPADPGVRDELLGQLPANLGFVHAAEKFIETDRPDVILVNEPNTVLGPFVDAAIVRGIPTVQFVQPTREDALVFKRLTPETRRVHPNSVARDTLERLIREPWTAAHDRQLDDEFQRRYGGAWRIQERNQPGTVDMSAQEIRSALALDAEKPAAVLFSHVLWDANLFYGRDLFDNYGHWFVETVRAAAANPRLNWLVKLHPANLWKRRQSGVTAEFDEVRLIRKHIGDLPSHVRLVPPDTKVSTLSLFRMADVGVTVRGSIGYEMPCFGVPVVTAGTGRYSGFGFTLDHDSSLDYLATLARLENVGRLSPETTHRARVHAYALMVRRPWIFNSFRAAIGRNPTDPLNQNLHLVAPGFDRIADNADLAAFADWIEAGEHVDFLSADPFAHVRSVSNLDSVEPG